MMPRRRTKLFAGGAVVIAGLATAGAATIANGTEPGPPADSDVPTAVDPDVELVSAARRDLSRSEEFDGMIGRPDAATLPIGGDGVVTRLPEIGDEIALGQWLLEVAGTPVLLMPGERPMWRELGPGVSDGVDVEQLEAALVAFGFASADELTVDESWTWDTTRAVKDLQEMNGMPEDGRLGIGEIVYATDPVRVVGVGGALGDDAASAAIEVASTDLVVTASIPIDDADLFAAGDVVGIELPDGEAVDGQVTEIGAPVADGEGAVTVPVTLTVDGLVDALDGLPVELTIDVVSAADVIAVPVEALLALAEGGYAVEVLDGAGRSGTRLVGVEVGVFSDGWVEVIGDIADGDQVVIP